ncbi:hypothetical protein GH714_027101 [Hevea brasiliensis]|uniref:Uncharacterized protein n=1 Tax=Hevea brasiliensis TaxID=3981 RepID=A0A6A6N649_HEVBR|nr:hypothetical protein GH714_027101 [Hevea brasiliensis]
MQQQMIQQLLQEMSNNSGGGVQQHPFAGQNMNGSMASNGLGFGSNSSAAPPAAAIVSGSVAGQHQDDIVPDIAHEFTDNGFFNGDLDDNIGYGWKA